MPVLNQNQKNNTVIVSSSIKTMRKDLQRLREADVVSESQRIIGAKPFEKPAAPAVQLPKVTPFEPAKIAKKSPPIVAPTVTMPERASKLPRAVAANPPKPSVAAAPIPTVKALAVKPLQPIASKPISVTLEQRSAQEQKAVEQAKEFTTETEKQQLFLLEAEYKKLQQQLQATSKEQEPQLELEKNDILLKQESQHKLLQPLLDQEAKLEARQQAIESQETQTNIPAKKQELEQQRWKLEEQREHIEKKRWAVERELATLEKQAKELEAKYATLNAQKSDIAKQGKEINLHIKETAANAIARERAKRENAAHETQKQSAQEKSVQQKDEEHQKVEGLKNEQKKYTQTISQAAKETFVASVKNEEERRKKFLEDIEAWAASQKK